MSGMLCTEVKAMKILYKQPSEAREPFLSAGIERCYCKHLCIERDTKRITTKSHHHTETEIHIMENGHQTYIVDGQTYTVGEGQYLLIPPTFSHCILSSAPHTTKFSITFHASDPWLSGSLCRCRVGTVNDRMRDTIRLIVSESARRRRLSDALIGGWVFECIAHLLRDSGIEERVAPTHEEADDPRYLMAIQFINDNIEQAPTVSDVAQYCHLSDKQLSRLFAAANDLTVAQYIRAQRIRRIERMLADERLTIREISEQMSFSDEHYFNAFFKKYAGMTPGKYRRMQQ